MLPTFYAWSTEHIRRVFEAKSENDCLKALDDTFSQRLEFTFNGSPLPREGLQKIVLAMLQASGFCLNVDWLNAVEVPRDGSNRVSALPCERMHARTILTHLVFLSLPPPWVVTERDARRVLHHPECQEARPWFI